MLGLIFVIVRTVITTHKHYRMSVPGFGQEMRDQQYGHLLPEVAFLNHGAYGEVPKQVDDDRMVRHAEFMSSSIDFMTRKRSQYWDEAVEVLAPFVGTTSDLIALVDNATTGINNVLKSLTFETGDAILYNNLTYRTAKNIINAVADKNPGLSLVEMTHVYPITSAEQIIQQYETTLDANPNIKVAVVDHMSSQPIMLFPVAEITAACKARGVMVLIDGAHSPGHVPLSLDTLGADFYIGNIHKWISGAKSCAFLYVDTPYHDIIRPVMTSFDYNTSFPGGFKEQSTIDYVCWHVSKTAVEFYNWAGGMSAISAYNTDLADRMADMLTTAWGTTKLDIPADMEAPFGKMIWCPSLPDYPPSSGAARNLTSDLRDLYNIIVSVNFYEGNLNFRVSTYIYCVEEDYQRLRDAVLELRDNPPPKPKTDRSHYIMEF